MYMTNLYAYDKKLYLTKDRRILEDWGSVNESDREMRYHEIFLARPRTVERDKGEKNRFISALRNKRKKETVDPMDRIYRFTRLIGNKFVRCFSLKARLFVNTLIVELIHF